MIELEPETRKRMVESIRRYFEHEMDEEIGDLRAGFLLDYFLSELAPTVYNRAIGDTQAWMLGRIEDLDGSLHEPEFGYWKR